MTSGTFAGIVTAVLLATFVGGWIWAWRPSRRAEFDAAARMPLDDDGMETPIVRNAATESAR